MTPAPVNSVKVWDRLVRLTHWSVAILILANFLNESGSIWHRYAGYAAVGFVAVRGIWGLFSRGYARFSRWWPGFSGIRKYVRSTLAGNAPRFVGINPAGACMAVLLWLMVFLLGTTGWMMRWDAFWGEEWLEELHMIIAYTLLACVGIHIASVLLVSFRHRENLPKSMITGKKRGL